MTCAVKILAIVGAISQVSAQGLPPRASPLDYPAHAALDKNFTLAAENLLHTLPTANGSLVANDYLVIEAAAFGPVKERIDLAAGNFTLVITMGKNTSTVHADSSGSVAASIKFSDWTQRPGASLSGGVGDTGATIGTQTPAGHFPGDPSVRPPYPSPVPPQENPAGIEREPAVPIDERIQRASLPEGNSVAPVAGLLFFPFRGKTKSIKSLELVYDGPAGHVKLKLD
jgi:hypothetical protein